MENGSKLGVLEVYTHGARLLGRDDRVKIACRRVLNNWVIMEEVREENARGETVTKSVIKQLYGAAFPGQNDFWFHKGQLKELDTELKTYGLTLEDLELKVIPTHTPDKVKFNLRQGRVLRDYQEDAKRFALSPVTEGDHFSKLIAMPTGSGKAIAWNSRVETPAGPKLINQIALGTPILCPDGEYHEVLGIYDQGLREMIRITTEDGRHVDADLEHLWKFKEGESGEYVVKTSREMMECESPRIPLYTPPPDKLDPEKDAELKMLTEWLDIWNADIVIRDGWFVFDKRSPGFGGANILDALYKYGFAAVECDDCLRFRSPNPWDIIDRSNFSEADIAELNLSTSLGICKIEPFPVAQSFCISVGHDEELFLCNDYIVTHNTVTSCGTAADNGERLVVGVLPRYAKKWCKDLDDNLDVGKKGIMPVESISQLRGLIHVCKEQGSKKLPPVIVITLSTMRMFLDKFSSNPKECVEDMGCEPWELMGLLGAGMFAIDEAHEHINTVFLTSMYLHGVKFVAMSGTMRTEDAFEEKVQNAIFPMIKRYLDVKMEKYIDVEFIGYNFHHSVLPKMKCSAFGRTDYSHPVLEKSIIKYPQVLKSYIRIITDLLDFDYIPRANGKRALVFVATVDMADKVVAALTTRYPHLEIARYCAAQGDKYSDLLEADITVSTLQSSGTAVDIPNLISVVCSTMVNSSKANIQALGRLRKLPNDEKVTMYLPFCRQNKKHLKYMAFRHELFRDITKSIKVFNYDRWIGEPSY